ncbi:MAG: hypothetical protein ACRYGR_03400 [Janthinobacterium lividum]
MNIYKITFFSLIILLNQQVMSSDIFKNSDNMEIGESNQRGQKRNWDKVDLDEINSNELNLNQRFDLSKYFQKNKKQKINPVVVKDTLKRNRDQMDLDEDNPNEDDFVEQKKKAQKIEHIVTVEDFSRLRSLVPPEYTINRESRYLKHFLPNEQNNLG